MVLLCFSCFSFSLIDVLIVVCGSFVWYCLFLLFVVFRFCDDFVVLMGVVWCFGVWVADNFDLFRMVVCGFEACLFVLFVSFVIVLMLNFVVCICFCLMVGCGQSLFACLVVIYLVRLVGVVLLEALLFLFIYFVNVCLLGVVLHLNWLIWVLMYVGVWWLMFDVWIMDVWLVMWTVKFVVLCSV